MDLVGGFHHLEKYESQWEGWHPIYYEKESKKCYHQPYIYIFDASYQPFMVIFGMVYHCVTNIATNHDLIMGWNSWNQTPGIRIHLQYRTRTMMGDVYVYRII